MLCLLYADSVASAVPADPEMCLSAGSRQSVQHQEDRKHSGPHSQKPQRQQEPHEYHLPGVCGGHASLERGGPQQMDQASSLEVGVIYFPAQ